MDGEDGVAAVVFAGELELEFKLLELGIDRLQFGFGFSGDAFTCWFDKDDSRRATTSALAMQQAAARFSSDRKSVV